MTETKQYDTLREKIAAEKAARQARYAAFRRIYDEAVIEATQAAHDVVPTPMIVSGYEDQPVMDGVCGFAWVLIKPGNSSFALWLKREGYARTDSYYGGVSIWVSAFGQSMARKEAYADSLADSLRKAFPDLRILPMSRMD